MKVKPFPFQKEGVRALRKFNGRALLADEMGLGKTIQVLAWLERTPSAWPALVVCPASVKSGWERQALHNLNIHAKVLEGKQGTELRNGLREHELVIINYDILASWLEFLKKMKFKSLIIDEGQYCANRNTKRTKACKELSRVVENVVVLTGTPLVNRPSELWPVLNMINPKQFSSFWAFAHEYCAPRKLPWGWQFDGATNIEKLNKVLTNDLMIRRRKADVMSQLPDKIRDIVLLPIENAKDYHAAEHDFAGWIRRNQREKAARAKKAIALTRLGYLRRLAAKYKLKSTVDWINNWIDANPDEKLVVFAWHTKMIDALQRRIKTSSVVVNGQVNAQQRKLSIKKFMTDRSCQVFIGNIQACGTGLDGLQVASTAVFVEIDLRPGVTTQAEDRLHRIGQKSTAWIYYLIAEGTIEHYLCELVQKKQSIVSAVLDGQVEASDINIFDILMKYLQTR